MSCSSGLPNEVVVVEVNGGSDAGGLGTLLAVIKAL